MGTRTLMRAGAVALMTGAVLAVVDNALHPHAENPADLAAVARMITGSTIWAGAHTGLFFAVLLLAGGLVALGRSITAEAAWPWARLGEAAAVVSAAAFTVLSGIDGLARKTLAEAWAGAMADDQARLLDLFGLLEQINFGIASAFIVVFFGVTFLLFGVAVAAGNEFPRWLGWVALAAGAVSGWIGLHGLYRGPTPVVWEVLFPVFSILLAVWAFVMGVLLWRRAARA